MKPKLTFGRYIIALLLTVTACAAILATNISKMNTDLSEQNDGLKRQIDALSSWITCNSKTITEYKTQISSLSTEISSLRQDVESKADKQDRGGDGVRYELAAEERKLVEQVVTAESRDEPYTGQMLVCQCILNACENLGKRPADIVRIYKYATARPTATDSVKRAVTAVFDRGETVTEEPIIYFYAPAVVESKFHERQRFVVRVGCHKFFAEK